MRPSLVRNFNPVNTISAVSPNLYIAWDWSVRFNGILNLTASTSEGEVLAHLNRKTTGHRVVIRDDGLIIDGFRPWLTAVSDTKHADANLVVNLQVVKLIVEQLFGFYAQIDFEKLKRRVLEQPSETTQEDDLLVLACHSQAELEPEDIVQVDAKTVPSRRTRTPTWNFLGIMSVFETKFGCQIKPGKGSHVTVWRPGARKAVCRRHKKDYVVQPETLKSWLRKLDITVAEFCAMTQSK